MLAATIFAPSSARYLELDYLDLENAVERIEKEGVIAPDEIANAHNLFLHVTVEMGLGGAALMLWAVTPVAQIHTPWLLFVTPMMPLLATIACQWAARKQVQNAAFVNLSQQMHADMALLRAVATP